MSTEYSNYDIVFFFNLAMKLPENTNINKHVIKLVDCKQLSYSLIYTLSLEKLKNLKAYIKAQQKSRFINLSRSPIGASIFFDTKTDGGFHLYLNY